MIKNSILSFFNTYPWEQHLEDEVLWRVFGRFCSILNQWAHLEAIKTYQNILLVSLKSENLPNYNYVAFSLNVPRMLFKELFHNVEAEEGQIGCTKLRSESYLVWSQRNDTSVVGNKACIISEVRFVVNIE